MKNIHFYILIPCMLFGLLLPSHAEKVNPEKAQRVAQGYVQSKQRLHTKPDVSLKHTATGRRGHGSGIQRTSQQETQDTVFYYVFGLGDAIDGGFVIVAGDDAVKPVLGYSECGSYDENNLPPNFAYWMDFLKQEIAYTMTHHLPQSENVKQEWASYLDGDLMDSWGSVAPLVQSRWNQTAPYNNSCPTINGARTITGCVATAMAQVMNFHQHPARGSGHSQPYNTGSGLSIPSIDFEIDYDWKNMLNSYSGTTTALQREAVATLMYHCGASVEMNYNTGASSAVSSKVVDALINYFGYDHNIRMRRREHYDNDSWNLLLKSQIDAGLPIYYDGQNPSAGHAFVCDGYDNAGLFHFNWGWGGLYDGYFVTSSLNPGTGGAGSGTGTYNQGQSVIINIKPGEGSEFNWTYSDGTLTLSGKGAMPKYNSTGVFAAPWIAHRNSITKVVINEGITTIGDLAFRSCTALKNITIPNSVTTIGAHVFFDCSSLTSVTIPESVISIEEGAFRNTGLTSVTIPRSVTFIGNDAFISCSKLLSINVDENNYAYSSESGVLFNKAKTAIILYPEGKPDTKYIIPESVLFIGYLAFADCSKLTAVTIPESVNSIRDYAFYGCNGLTEITNLAIVPQDISANVFSNNKSRCKLQVPEGSVEDYSLANVWKDFDVMGISTLRVGSVSLHKSALFLAVGDTEQLFHTLEPYNAANRNVVWSSDNSNIATVSENGTVTAKAIGTATITVTTEDGAQTAICNVSVIIPVTGVSLDKSTLPLALGASEQLVATIEPTNATIRNVAWSSNHTDVVTVSENGTVTGKSIGTAMITVTTENGDKTATCEIIVTIPVTDIILNKTSLTLPLGGMEQLEATVEPADATHPEIRWSSSNTDVAIVGEDDGWVQAMTAGTTIITVSLLNGPKTATCEVTVPSLTGAEISDVHTVRVYPNPTDGVFTLELEVDDVYSLTLTDISGRALMRKTVTGQNILQIDLSNYPSGAYLLTIDGKCQTTTKIIKK